MSPRPASTTRFLPLARSPGIQLFNLVLIAAIGAMSDCQADAQESGDQPPAKRQSADGSAGATGPEHPSVAGRTASEWARLLDDAAPETRRFAAANLAQFGPRAVTELLAAARHDDVDVRFWAFRGLRRSDASAKADITPESEAAVVKAAAEAMRDPAPSVRLAAASTLASFNRIEKASPILVAELSAPQGGTRILAISELARLHQAKATNLDMATMTAIRRAKDEEAQNEYVVRIAKRILGESNE